MSYRGTGQFGADAAPAEGAACVLHPITCPPDQDCSSFEVPANGVIRDGLCVKPTGTGLFDKAKIFWAASTTNKVLVVGGAALALCVLSNLVGGAFTPNRRRRYRRNKAARVHVAVVHRLKRAPSSELRRMALWMSQSGVTRDASELELLRSVRAELARRASVAEHPLPMVTANIRTAFSEARRLSGDEKYVFRKAVGYVPEALSDLTDQQLRWAVHQLEGQPKIRGTADLVAMVRREQQERALSYRARAQATPNAQASRPWSVSGRMGGFATQEEAIAWVEQLKRPSPKRKIIYYGSFAKLMREPGSTIWEPYHPNFERTRSRLHMREAARWADMGQSARYAELERLWERGQLTPAQFRRESEQLSGRRTPMLSNRGVSRETLSYVLDGHRIVVSGPRSTVRKAAYRLRKVPGVSGVRVSERRTRYGRNSNRRVA